MIKAKFEDLALIQNDSYTLRLFDEPEFTSPFHFHPEYELTAILSGHGSRFVGNHMDSFGPGDLVLIGSNLPHCWKSVKNQSQPVNSSSIVVQFKENFLGDSFFHTTEASQLLILLQKSKYGIQFFHPAKDRIIARLAKLSSISNAFSRLLLFLDILNELSVDQNYKLLNEQDLTNSDFQDERLNAVHSYIIDHFKDKISLDEVAGLANMSPNAFCKFYKRITKRTLTETIASYRINYAMQQLVSTHKSISEVSFESGFTDVSYFFKIFKNKLKESPLSYRKNYRKALSMDEISYMS